MSKLLLDEHPLVIIPSLAVEIGLNESIVLQQLHYWIKKSKNFHDGRQWVFNTYEQWKEQFPFWSTDTIKRTFSSLEKIGLIQKRQIKANFYDRTNYYTINYEKLSSLPDRTGQNAPMDECKMPIIEQGKMHSSLTETTTEITTETTLQSHTSGDADAEQWVTDFYSNVDPSFPRIQKLTKPRLKKVATRMREGLGAIELAQAVSEQVFLLGSNPRGWKADFDWLIEGEKNYVKVLERRYMNSAPSKPQLSQTMQSYNQAMKDIEEGKW